MPATIVEAIDQRRHHSQIELRARAIEQILNGRVERHAGPVGARAHHADKRIRHGDDPRGHQNIVARDAHGFAAAIRMGLCLAQGLHDRPLKFHPFEQVHTSAQGVANPVDLIVRQSAVLHQERTRHQDLADIHQARRLVHRVNQDRIEAHFLGNGRGHLRHPGRLMSRIGVAPVDDRQQCISQLAEQAFVTLALGDCRGDVLLDNQNTCRNMIGGRQMNELGLQHAVRAGLSLAVRARDPVDRQKVRFLVEGIAHIARIASRGGRAEHTRQGLAHQLVRVPPADNLGQPCIRKGQPIVAVDDKNRVGLCVGQLPDEIRLLFESIGHVPQTRRGTLGPARGAMAPCRENAKCHQASREQGYHRQVGQDATRRCPGTAARAVRYPGEPLSATSTIRNPCVPHGSGSHHPGWGRF